MRSALYEWPFAMHLLWEYRRIIDVLLEGIMGLMVAAISLQYGGHPVSDRRD